MEENPQPTSIKERMLLICNMKGVSPNKLSQDLGKSRDYIRTISENYTVDLLRSINRIYPDINLMWLITGQGSMVIDTSLESMDFHSLLNLYMAEREKNDRLQQEVSSLKNEIVNLLKKLAEGGESKAV